MSGTACIRYAELVHGDVSTLDIIDVQVANLRLPPARTGEDMGDAALGGMKRALSCSSRHRNIQLAQEHVNMYTKNDGDATYQPMHRLAKSQGAMVAEGGKEVRDAAFVNLVVWPCLASAGDNDFPRKWSLNFKASKTSVCLQMLF